MDNNHGANDNQGLNKTNIGQSSAMSKETSPDFNERFSIALEAELCRVRGNTQTVETQGESSQLNNDVDKPQTASNSLFAFLDSYKVDRSHLNNNVDNPQYATGELLDFLTSYALESVSSGSDCGFETMPNFGTILVHLDCEILEIHKELRIISENLGKAQAALEQLRRCHLKSLPCLQPSITGKVRRSYEELSRWVWTSVIPDGFEFEGNPDPPMPKEKKQKKDYNSDQQIPRTPYHRTGKDLNNPWTM